MTGSSSTTAADLQFATALLLGPSCAGSLITVTWTSHAVDADGWSPRVGTRPGGRPAPRTRCRRTTSAACPPTPACSGRSAACRRHTGGWGQTRHPIFGMQPSFLDAHVGRDGEGGLGVVPGLVLRTPMVRTVRVKERGVGIPHVPGVPDDVSHSWPGAFRNCVNRLPSVKKVFPRLAGRLPCAVVRLVGSRRTTRQLFEVPALRPCRDTDARAASV